MQQQLRRDLGLPQAMLTVIGIVIGSGIFALPAVVFAQALAPGVGLFAWVVGGLVSLAAGLTVAELTAAMPRAGGTYVYLREAYGEWVGFLQGWASFLAYYPAMTAAIAMLFTAYLDALIPLSPAAQRAIGLILILGLTGINILGVRFGGLVQVVATVGKLVPIALLILFGLPQMETARLLPLLPEGGFSLTVLAAAVLPVLWAYDGWIQVGMIAEEVKRPQRNLPLAIIAGLLLVTAVYVLFNVALAGALPMETLTGTDKPVMPLARLLFGEGGSKLITVGMLISMFGTLNGIVMVAPRYYFAMARDGLFPAADRVAALHPKHGTPVLALVLSAAWSSVLLLSGGFEQLLNLVVFAGWLFYLLAMIAVFVLRRKRPEMERPYRVWGYPVVPVVGIASGLWILLSSFQSDPATALLGTGLTATGVPVYLWLRHRQGATAREAAHKA